VYRNTHAVVRPKNLLGETYVEIDRGTPEAGQFHEGETVSLVNTLTPVQVDEVLNALDPDTRSKLGIVINALGAATAQRGTDLNLSAGDFRRIAADVAVTSTSLDQEKSNLDALITQLDLMQKTVADYHDQLAQVLQKWNDSSTTMMKHDVALADALGHLSNILGDFDTALTPNAQALKGAVAKLPSAVNDTSDFLGISGQITDYFLQQRVDGTYPLQDGVALFPRLAQVMLGANRCDTHIYANGYQNRPAATDAGPATENPACAGLAMGSLQGEAFTGTPAAGTVPSDRHLWRVMGMLEAIGSPAKADCGILTPDHMAPSDAACAPGNNGLGPYKGPIGSPSVSSSTLAPSNGNASSFWGQVWDDFFGAWHA
jgi:hypothetical protein